MKNLFLLTEILFMFTAVNLYSAEKNIFESGKGVEKQLVRAMPNNRDFNSDKEFIAYSKAFRQNKNLLEYNIPTDSPQRSYHFSGLGAFAVKGAFVYQFKARINKLRRLDVVYIYVSFFKGNKFLDNQQLLMIPSTHDVTMTGYFVDFATPAQTDKIIIWFGLSGDGKILKPGTGAVLDNIKIIEKGKVSSGKTDNTGTCRNLSPVSGFEKEKLGSSPEWGFMKSGKGKYKLKINITGDEKEKYIHIKKNDAQKYSWFHFTLPEGDFYYNKLFRFSLRVKGIGKIRLGIWWQKAGQSYEFKNSKYIKLTEKWQDVKYELYCNDPATTSAAIAICLDSAQASVFADDIKFIIVPCTGSFLKKQIKAETN